jgi:hypothetical protein
MEDVAVAAVSILAAAMLAVIAARLLARLVKTIVELKKIATGLHTLGWALRNLPPDPVVGGTVTNGRKPGSG